MNELVQALALADEDFFIGLSNKGVYKRAMKDIEGVSFQMPSIEDNQINVPIAEDRVTLMLPLSESKCSCVSRTICRHIISAMLLVKNNLPEEVIEINEKRAEIEDKVNVQEIKEETKPELSEKQIIQINSTSGDALSVLAEILISGMVRLPDRIEEKIEIMAVQCHALKMADAERILRDIGNRLNECVSRKSSFNKKVFLRNYCEGIKVLTMLSKPDITANNLGVFRRTYEEHDDNLSLLPIGNRQVFGNDYEGDIYYFLDTNENVARRFYSLSDIRPTFYFNQGKRKTTQPSEVRPWGLNVPLKKMMHTKMTLKHAKTCKAVYFNFTTHVSYFTKDGYR